jgi:hypothetical protein
MQQTFNAQDMFCPETTPDNVGVFTRDAGELGFIGRRRFTLKLLHWARGLNTNNASLLKSLANNK